MALPQSAARWCVSDVCQLPTTNNAMSNFEETWLFTITLCVCVCVYSGECRDCPSVEYTVWRGWTSESVLALLYWVLRGSREDTIGTSVTVSVSLYAQSRHTFIPKTQYKKIIHMYILMYRVKYFTFKLS